MKTEKIFLARLRAKRIGTSQLRTIYATSRSGYESEFFSDGVTTTRFFGVLRDIGGLGQLMGEVVGTNRTGSISIDITRGTFTDERSPQKRISDFLDQYTFVHQDIWIYAAEYGIRDLSLLGDRELEFRGEMVRCSINPIDQTMTIEVAQRDMPEVQPHYTFPVDSSIVVQDIYQDLYPICFGDASIQINAQDYATLYDAPFAGSNGQDALSYLRYASNLYNADPDLSFTYDIDPVSIWRKNNLGRWREVELASSGAVVEGNGDYDGTIAGSQPYDFLPASAITSTNKHLIGGIAVFFFQEMLGPNISGKPTFRVNLYQKNVASENLLFEILSSGEIICEEYGPIGGSPVRLAELYFALDKLIHLNQDEIFYQESIVDDRLAVSATSAWYALIHPTETNDALFYRTFRTSREREVIAIGGTEKYSVGYLPFFRDPSGLGPSVATEGCMTIFAGIEGFDSVNTASSPLVVETRTELGDLKLRPENLKIIPGGLKTNSTALTGTSGQAITRADHIVKMLWATMYGSTTDLDTSKFSPGDYAPEMQGHSEGTETCVEIMFEILRESCGKLVPKRVGGAALWMSGIIQEPVAYFTEATCRLKSVNYVGSDAIVNTVTLRYGRSAIVDHVDEEAYKKTLKKTNLQSFGIYGRRLARNVVDELPYIEDDSVAERFANYITKYYGFERIEVTLEVPYWAADNRKIEIYDIIYLSHIDLPSEFGSAPENQEKIVTTDGVDVGDEFNHYDVWRRAKACQLRIIGREPRISIGGESFIEFLCEVVRDESGNKI